MSAGKTPIDVRLRAERKHRMMTVEALAEAFREYAVGRDRRSLPKVRDLCRMIRGYEAGEHVPGPRYRMLYTAVFGMSEDELFGEADTLDARTDDPAEMAELARRAGGSDLGTGTLDDIAVLTDRLCREYPRASASALRERVHRSLRYVLGLLDGRLTLHQHRELLVQAGWLAALLSCVDYDLGRRASAEVARRMAHRLGEQAGHGEIVGWAWEIAAWFALTEGRHRDAVAAARAGRERVSHGNAGVQLAFQEARALARTGDRNATDALKAGTDILRHLPYPAHPEHHFVVDRDKHEFYVATILTWLGHEDAVAAEHAREVIARSPAGTWPMRAANAHIDLGIIAGRHGDLDEAIDHGHQALRGDRRSAQLLPRAIDLHGRLAQRYPEEALVHGYEELLRDECRAM